MIPWSSLRVQAILWEYDWQYKTTILMQPREILDFFQCDGAVFLVILVREEAGLKCKGRKALKDIGMFT